MQEPDLITWIYKDALQISLASQPKTCYKGRPIKLEDSMVTETSIAASMEAGVRTFATDFDKLAQKHYRRSSSEILNGFGDEDLARLQYARAFGVLVKQPFAKEVDRRPSKKTRSVIAMRWKDEAALGARQKISSLPPSSKRLWQSKFLTALAEDENPQLPPEVSLKILLDDAYLESRLGEHIFRAFRRYVCARPAQKKAVKAALRVAEKSGSLGALPLSVDTLKIQAASTVAVAVSHAMPLAIAACAAPLIGGFAFLLLEVGVDGFCSWSSSIEQNGALRSAEGEDQEPLPKKKRSKIKNS